MQIWFMRLRSPSAKDDRPLTVRQNNVADGNSKHLPKVFKALFTCPDFPDAEDFGAMVDALNKGMILKGERILIEPNDQGRMVICHRTAMALTAGAVATLEPFNTRVEQ
jgi:hypothetical protein